MSVWRKDRCASIFFILGFVALETRLKSMLVITCIKYLIYSWFMLMLVVLIISWTCSFNSFNIYRTSIQFYANEFIPNGWYDNWWRPHKIIYISGKSYKFHLLPTLSCCTHEIKFPQFDWNLPILILVLNQIQMMIVKLITRINFHGILQHDECIHVLNCF